MSETIRDSLNALPDGVVDDMNVHLPVAREMDRAALLPGMYLAWCARLGLLDKRFSEAHAELLLRLHYNDGPCCDLFVSACAGTLRYEQLNERGRAFTRRYYSQYLDDWRAVFGDDIYAVEDSWPNYQRVADVLTRALMGGSGASGTEAKGKERWWKFWK